MNSKNIKIVGIDPSAIQDNGKIKQPAVTFEYNRAVAADGTTATNGDIYEGFIQINDKSMAVSTEALMAGASPAFIAGSIRDTCRNTYDTIVDSYLNAVANHYYNFVTAFNYMMDSLVGEKLDPDDRHLEYYLWAIRRNGALDTIKQFFNLSMDAREQVIRTGALDAYCITGTNIIGENVYTKTYEIFARAIAILKVSDESALQGLINQFNAIFATFMRNLTYECGVFVNNITSFHPMIIDDATIQKIADKDPELKRVKMIKDPDDGCF